MQSGDTPVQFNAGWNDGDEAISCPNCGDAYLRSGAVRIRERSVNEDGPGHELTVEHGVVQREELPADHPRWRGRRQDVAIAFECENCDASPLILRLVQHKGVTFLHWSQDEEFGSFAPRGDE
jgi:hypothetical protein